MCFSDTGEATLRIIGAASEDDGVYTCVATNDLGSVTSSACLRVLGRNTEMTAAISVCPLTKLVLRLPFVSGVSTDGIRVSWKDNFDSHYTEVVELGR